MNFLKKNKFWISSFLLVATMIGTWFYATGALKAATDSRVNEIVQAKNKAEAVSRLQAEEGVQVHPNKTTEDGMNAKIDKLAESVLAAWKKRYEAQRNVMKWPEKVVGKAFTREFNKYNPPETLPAEEKGKSSIRMQKLLRVYKQQIPSQMKNICSVINTKWLYQSQLDAEAFSGPDENKKTDGEEEQADEKKDAEDQNSTGIDSSREIVKWNSINQDLWFQKLTSFRGRDDNEFKIRLPSPSQVYMLQQDLWLLEAMFDIIRVVNSQLDEEENPVMDSDGKPKMVFANDLAAVKEIDHVVFGREALSLLGNIKDTISDSPAAGASALGGDGRNQRNGRNNSKDSDSGLAYLGQPAFHGRYVDPSYEPIEADTIRKVLAEKNLPKDDLELVVAKRVPVRVAVQMDEREIPRFLAACANSPFEFEVRQVRINTHDPEEIIKMRGSETEGAGNSRRLGGPTVGSTGGATDDNSSKTKVAVALRRSYDVGVEFYGIIKIYNPPNEALITGQQVAGSNP